MTLNIVMIITQTLLILGLFLLMNYFEIKVTQTTNYSLLFKIIKISKTNDYYFKYPFFDIRKRLHKINKLLKSV